MFSKENVIKYILFPLVVVLISTVLNFLFREEAQALLVIIKYYFIFPPVFFIRIYIALLIAIIVLSFFSKKIHEFLKSHSNIVFIFILFALFFVALSVINNKSKIKEEEVSTFHFAGFITRQADGFYTYNNSLARELNAGFEKALFEKPLRINSIISDNYAPKQKDGKSFNIERIGIQTLKVSKLVLDYYGLQRRNLKELFFDHYKLKSPMVWFEISEKGQILDIGFMTAFPLFIHEGNIAEIFQLKDKVNRFVQIEEVTPYLKGIYLGKIYKAMAEQVLVSEFINSEEYELAMGSIQNMENEFLALDKILRDFAKDLSQDNAQKLLNYADEDLKTWSFYSNHFKFEVYREERKYNEAEIYLKKMFESGLYLKNTDFRTFLGSFQKKYFGDGLTSEELIKKMLVDMGFTYKTELEQFNAVGLDSLLVYARDNKDFDYNTFYEWLHEKYPDDPVVYMYWGKTNTDKENFALGAEKYRKAVELFPESPILNIFYQTAILNDIIQNSGKNQGEVERKIDKAAEEFSKYINSPELAPFMLE